MVPNAGRVLAVACTLLLSACAAAAPGGPPTSAPPPTAAQTAPSPPSVGSPIAVSSPSPQANPALEAAMAQAATRLGIARADLRIDRLEAREWPDAALGCPQPGVLYAQVLSPGYLIVISGAGKQLEYHTDERGKVVLCQER
jgi:CO/xanthine dehydrogenase Mo-binding subunit